MRGGSGSGEEQKNGRGRNRRKIGEGTEGRDVEEGEEGGGPWLRKGLRRRMHNVSLNIGKIGEGTDLARFGKWGGTEERQTTAEE